MLRGAMRVRGVALNVLLVLVPTVVLCLFAIEVPLRLAGYGRLEIYQPDPVVFWKLKPNQDGLTKVGQKKFHINTHGTRGREFTREKPADAIRILSLGDSRTFGWGLADDETYSSRIEAALQQQIGGRARVEVINAGVNAWSFPQMDAYFRREGLAYRPDYVILGDGNAWTQFVEGADPAFVRRFAWSVRLKNLLRRFAAYHYLIEVKLEDFYQRHRTKFSLLRRICGSLINDSGGLVFRSSEGTRR